MDACMRQDIFPKAMEHLPAGDADAVRVSLEMVDQADIYIGIYAWRYGHIPEGQDISITEMEFDRAVKRGIPILVFLIHKDHPLTIDMVEAREGAQKKLAALKERSSHGRRRREFRSPVELRGEVIHALADLKEREQSAGGDKPVPRFHPPSFILTAPAPYIAHPYTLLQTRDLVGRQAELNRLTDWVTKPELADIRLFHLVAIGGMGKSALAWKWFNDIAPKELPKLAGRIWWSFYESDAHYENFLLRALAYAAGETEEALRVLSVPEREDRLFALLDARPFLLVLDGLERILLAYARMDAAQMLDDDLDAHTAHRMTEAQPEAARETYLEKHRLRRTADPRAGMFLKRLARLRHSRVLVSTRLYPADLQLPTAAPLPGCHAEFLDGLTDDDALNLWRAFGVTGSREQLLPLFRAFGNYPLLLRALAGEIAEYRRAPRDLDRWRAAHPGFDPARLDLRNAKTHVLEYALRGLGDAQRGVLHTLAAFRMPAGWETLRALLTGEDKACPNERRLDAVLTELEDRGLVGWDKRANRYDLHPIVRGVVWQALDGRARHGIYGELHGYFDALPKVDYERVERLEDLTAAIELYHALVGLERYDDAYDVFWDELEKATLYRLSASRKRAELLQRLFPDGVDAPPRLQAARAQSYTLNALALAYKLGGEPGRAVPLFRRCIAIDEREGDQRGAAVSLCNLSDTLRLAGKPREAEYMARRALWLCRQKQDRYWEAVSLQWIGLTLALCGNAGVSETALRRALAIFSRRRIEQSEGVLTAYLAQRLLWLGKPGPALPLARRAWDLASVERRERDFIRAARVHGTAALRLGDLDTAGQRLRHALTRARAVNLFEQELPALTALAELHRQNQDYAGARDLLDHLWEPARRGPYPTFHADALNVLAQIEREERNRDAAVATATQAYELAWCDGPPYAYHYGLAQARRHLEALNAPLPVLPPFDPTRFEPLPEVELNPNDEFHM